MHLKDHLALRQADLLARNSRVLRHPWLRLRQQVDESLRLRGLRLMKSSAKVRPYLGEYFLLDLRDRAVQRTNVDLLGLSRELGLETNHLSLGNEPEVNCDILLHTPTEVLG